MKRPWVVWLAFALSLALLLAAMGWLSNLLVRLDHQSKRALEEAAFQENIRLALWRMDSALSSLVGLENAIPPSSYDELFKREREVMGRAASPDKKESVISPYGLLHFAWTETGAPVSALTLTEKNDQSWRPNPEKIKKLAGIEQRFAALRSTLAGQTPPSLVTYDENIATVRPRVQAALKAVAPEENNKTPAPATQETEVRIALHPVNIWGEKPADDYHAGKTANVSTMAAEAGEKTGDDSTLTPNNGKTETVIPLHEEAQALQSRTKVEVQQRLNDNEDIARSLLVFDRNLQSNQANYIVRPLQEATAQQSDREVAAGDAAGNVVDSSAVKEQGEAQPAPAPLAQRMERRAEPQRQVVEEPRKMQVELLQAQWTDGALFLVRRVANAQEKLTQGVLLDWPALETMLLGLVRDLLPQAELAPAYSTAEKNRERLLAALPIRLFPGPTPHVASPLDPLLRISLGIAWCCVLLAGLAVGLVLGGAISLGNRRGAFVSAVTHELRTPLTTFRMYTEMLNEGMVTREEKRRHYLATLHREAERLGNLVENVLTYAQLEKKKDRRIREAFTPAQLLERMQDRLEDRAKQAGLRLVLDVDPDVENFTIAADVSAVERILFNLVDNSAKYAANPTRPEIRLSIVGTARRVSFQVRDYGPGIRAAFRGKLFKAFSKSAEDAAASGPGVGLGLNICRRLARQMGGELAFDCRITDGACFILSLPVVR